MKGRLILCGHCGKPAYVRKDGLVITHRGNRDNGRRGCPASGKPERND